ncbi:GntR family transcriptional regulator [Alkalicoccus daliensis]|uniref:Transcriptional regulator, GntR family n=1 Tax=Alkalicoccus daliensis TaxID=745820 RepID=A0A1H0GEJ4_9BACI|nr:GntR family transcriptional regulator [Alkalicoccus daliensis]SDO05292.1 transcriptional regulator, GntR family [Alkalicoccus daliensis]
MINKQSPIPIYYQIEEILRSQIEKGELAEEEMIPSERELAYDFNVSRMTIRQAISNLVSEGLLYKEKGKGTFVNIKRFEQPLMDLTSFSEDMLWRGLTPGVKLIDFKEVGISLQKSRHLQVEEGSKGYELSRIRLADEEPIAYEVMTLPAYLFPEIELNNLKSSFYQYVESKGMKIEGASQTIEPSLAREHEAELLNIEVGAPVLLMKRVSYLASGHHFEYVTSVYRGDKYKFVTQMKR